MSRPSVSQRWRTTAKINGIYRQAKLYRSWADMKTRCYRKTQRDYHNYGGKGIVVCDEWLIYSNFRAWAISNGFCKGMSIERLDNEQGYNPKNCTWIPHADQGKNTRMVKLLTHDGKTMNHNAWAKHLGIPQPTISQRLQRGWSVHETLTIPTNSVARKESRI